MGKKSNKKDYLVFISHSYPDRWIARMMAKQIETLPGVIAFLEVKDIKSGDSIPGIIRKNIKKCNEFVVLLSKNSIDRPWVLIEIGAAWVAGKRITAMLDNISPAELPAVISQKKALDLNEIESYLEQLLERVKSAEEKNEQKK